MNIYRGQKVFLKLWIVFWKNRNKRGKKMQMKLQNRTILVTGAAGFIGANLVLELFRTISSVHIIGIDSVNDYYDVSIKEYRLDQMRA